MLLTVLLIFARESCTRTFVPKRDHLALTMLNVSPTWEYQSPPRLLSIGATLLSVQRCMCFGLSESTEATLYQSPPRLLSIGAMVAACFGPHPLYTLFSISSHLSIYIKGVPYSLVLKLFKSGSGVWAPFPLSLDQNLEIWFPKNDTKPPKWPYP